MTHLLALIASFFTVTPHQCRRRPRTSWLSKPANHHRSHQKQQARRTLHHIRIGTSFSSARRIEHYEIAINMKLRTAANSEEGLCKPTLVSYSPEFWLNLQRRWPIYCRRMNSHPAAARQRRCASSLCIWHTPANGLALREDIVLSARETCSSNAPGTLWLMRNSKQRLSSWML